MDLKFSVFSFYVLLYLGHASGQVRELFQDKLVCIEHEECGTCISAAAHCRWCADPYFKSLVPRCNDFDSLAAAGCGQAAIHGAEKPVWEVVKNRSLQDMKPGNNESNNMVQIQPQKIRLSLKPRETKKIKFAYRPTKNYPLDLYYLMDLTWSMDVFKKRLVSLRDDLPVMLKNLTDNFRIGFGSFAEKPLWPYTYIDPKRREDPCSSGGLDQTCEATYSYRHALSLTNQVNEFIESVNRSSVTANLDNAEAQLEALVQVLACGEKIGWSERSRKIVLMLSDGQMHTAGDGLLGGATLKNDEKCHLDENGYYTESAIFDYPSIAQMHRLLDKYKVNVIFAVTEQVKPYYDKCQQLLDHFTFVAKLEADSSNILKLVKTGYEGIVSVVDFVDDSNLGPVKVKYFTDCGVDGASMIEHTECSGVEYGMTLNYEAHISLDSCPEYKKSTQTITIAETHLGQDTLTLEIDIQCGCFCENAVQEEVTSTCGFNKRLVCGVCLCNKGWSGPNCDCSIENDAAFVTLEAQCREPNASYPCSGAGDCVCGRCICDHSRNGRYCQCRRCPNSPFNGLECNGEEHGVCVCGQCACAEGWTGDACDCAISNETCIAPGSNDVCNGRGKCHCGRCQCSSIDQNGDAYTGVFCETCASCMNPLCATTEPYVSCYLNKDYAEICGGNYTVNTINDNYSSAPDATDVCVLRRFEYGIECEYTYTYNPASEKIIATEITIRSKVCYQTNAAFISRGLVIVLCIIAGGIVVIAAVKSAQIMSDRRAYARFVQEAELSKLETLELNPLYISPISVFKLPEEYPRD